MNDTALRFGSTLTSEEVAGWLRAHPRFLAEHPDLYRWLAPPERVHGDTFADHMAAMLRAERARAAAMVAQADGVLAAGRATAGLTARVHESVLALIRADDVAECVACELPPILGIDAAGLCIEGVHGTARMVSAGTVGRLLGHRAVLVRQAAHDGGVLHGEAALLAEYDALVSVPGAPPALLALSARDAVLLDPGQGTAPLAFLGRALAAVMGR